MKFSSKVLKCGLSPMRKFHPYAVAAEAKGRKIYHLNIGQPDIETPKAYFDAVKHFDLPVLAYAPSPGIPELIEAIRKYYADLGMHFDAGDILITNGGSEALQITMNCILDDGDEIIIPEPFYPNYHTFITTAGGVIRPLARVFDCTTFWGASSAAAGFAAKRHLFGIYGPYANSRRRHARNWLRDNLPESAYKGIINTKRAIFGPHHGPYED